MCLLKPIQFFGNYEDTSLVNNIIYYVCKKFYDTGPRPLGRKLFNRQTFSRHTYDRQIFGWQIFFRHLVNTIFRQCNLLSSQLCQQAIGEQVSKNEQDWIVN